MRTAPVARRPDDPVRVGPYAVVGVIGEGGMATVYLGRTPAGRLAAVKVMHRSPRLAGAAVERFRREIAAARRVSSSYTAAVDDADADADPPWYAAEYVRAPSLQQVVDAAGPLPVPAVRWLAAGLAEALRAIHARGVVHRDLKPANVLVEVAGPRLIDFGIARSLGEQGLTEPGLVVGTAAYLAPEQLAGRDTPAGDVFSLGSTIVHAATGHPPFTGADNLAVAAQILTGRADLADLPAELHPVVGRCLQVDPDRRPSPTELVTALATDLPTDATGASMLPRRAVEAIRRFERDDEEATERLPGDRAAPTRRQESAGRWSTPLDRVTALTAVAGTVVARRPGEVVALTAADGAVRWRAAAAGDTGPVAVGAGVVCFVDGDAVRCVRAGDGRPFWALGDPRVAPLAVFACAAQVYLRYPDRIRRVDRRSGRRRRSLRTADLPAVVIADDRIYARSPSSLFAYDGHANGYRWRVPDPVPADLRAVVMAVARDTLAVFTERGDRDEPTGADRTLVGLDRATGTVRWRATPPGALLLAVPGHGYLCRDGHGIVLIDAATGTARAAALPDPPTGVPLAVAGPTLVVANRDGLDAHPLP